MRGRFRHRGSRAAWPPEAPGGDYTNFDGEDEAEDSIEDLGSSGGPPVSKLRVNWSDQNNGRLLRLCIEQLRAGNYQGGQMNGQDYKAIAQGYFQQTGLQHDMKQIKNQISQLKSTYSF